ncbi:uncharacterized protein JN550_009984 [Neoarthrinium moseri]|uniref:uncharacterized protein n=1 Tax=Neoarthrinium moseri TaxID=1658444 RepID=UPI001FDE44CD|nr:uncharacterized protein JN550_009984 [Neoarthrinium moseri]KAI1862837.1 hypothetical protein JN550_009984 [Neoarthrinium moseri]
MASTAAAKAAEISQVCISMSNQASCQRTDLEQTEIEAFHAEHFSGSATQLFTTDFLNPSSSQAHDEFYEGYYEEYEEEDDGLGYYPDGVKRTLTDEQIAIFRHSELEALRRSQERSAEKATSNLAELLNTPVTDRESGEVPEAELSEGEEGEIEADTPQPGASGPPSKKKKRKKKSKNKNKTSHPGSEQPQKGDAGWFKKTVKPDLRKRTWDVVEAGMDSLDYDGLEAGNATGNGLAAQRRKISYDD